MALVMHVKQKSRSAVTQWHISVCRQLPSIKHHPRRGRAEGLFVCGGYETSETNYVSQASSCSCATTIHTLPDN